MESNNYRDLAMARITRASELLDDAKLLLEKGSFASANNRAYYALEKICTGLLASMEILSKSHRGVISQFNQYVVNNDKTPFDSEDYKIVARAETIRSKSDYDDFYIVNKEETKLLIENTEKFILKANEYLNSQLDM